MSYLAKYLKYKNKFANLKAQRGGNGGELKDGDVLCSIKNGKYIVKNDKKLYDEVNGMNEKDESVSKMSSDLEARGVSFSAAAAPAVKAHGQIEKAFSDYVDNIDRYSPHILYTFYKERLKKDMSNFSYLDVEGEWHFLDKNFRGYTRYLNKIKDEYDYFANRMNEFGFRKLAHIKSSSDFNFKNDSDDLYMYIKQELSVIETYLKENNYLK